MLCSSCRRGGTFNNAANQAMKDGHLAEFERYQDAAVQQHAHCEYPTSCPCEHFVGASLVRSV